MAFINIGVDIPWTLLALGIIAYVWGVAKNTTTPDVKAPYGLSYLAFTPRWVSNAIYGIDCVEVIRKGYTKFKTTAYKLIRSDVNMVVLPASNIAELSSLPIEIASGIRALERDLLGKWTGLHIIISSRLHHRVVQRKLTPNLSLVTPALEDEVTASVREYLPQSTEEWSEINPYFTLLKVSSRVSSRVLVGFPICRSPEWLDISMNFTENIFTSIVVMRFFPPWMYGILGWVLPSVYASLNHIRRAQKLLSPAFAQRLKELDEGTYKLKSTDEPNGFTWLAELAENEDRNPTKLAHYEVLLALASIHTTLLREVNVLYDVMAKPEYIDILRKEIAEVCRTPWTKSSYARLSKLDSVMRESQRMSPPTSIGLRRIMQQPYTLADGTHLPKGSYVCVPAYTIENDPAVTPNPGNFDGLRDYNKRQPRDEPPMLQSQPERDAISQSHQFTTTEQTVLGFGYGKTACPGRFFASLALKTVFVKLLSEYDFKFMDGGTVRPENIFAHEFVFPNRSNKILVRKRAGHQAPF